MYKIPIFTLQTRLGEQENSIWSLQTRKTRFGSPLLLYWSENLEGCGSKKWQEAVKVLLFISRGFEVKSWEISFIRSCTDKMQTFQVCLINFSPCYDSAVLGF